MFSTFPPVKIYSSFESRLDAFPWFKSAVLLALRLYLAKFFFSSGLTKISDFNKTIALFTDEYHVPLLPPAMAAVMSTSAELGLSVLLIFGLGTRLAATGFFLMTLVIELFVYPSAVTGLAENYYIFLQTLTLMAFGAGRISLDALIFNKAAPALALLPASE